MAEHRRYGLRYPCPWGMPANLVDVEAAVAVQLTAAARADGWAPSPAGVVDFRWVETPDEPHPVECRASVPVTPIEESP